MGIVLLVNKCVLLQRVFSVSVVQVVALLCLFVMFLDIMSMPTYVTSITCSVQYILYVGSL